MQCLRCVCWWAWTQKALFTLFFNVFCQQSCTVTALRSHVHLVVLSHRCVQTTWSVRKPPGGDFWTEVRIGVGFSGLLPVLVQRVSVHEKKQRTWSPPPPPSRPNHSPIKHTKLLLRKQLPNKRIVIEYRGGMQHIKKKKIQKVVWLHFVGIFNVQSLEIILNEYTFHHLEKRKHFIQFVLKWTVLIWTAKSHFTCK